MSVEKYLANFLKITEEQIKLHLNGKVKIDQNSDKINYCGINIGNVLDLNKINEKLLTFKLPFLTYRTKNYAIIYIFFKDHIQKDFLIEFANDLKIIFPEINKNLFYEFPFFNCKNNEEYFLVNKKAYFIYNFLEVLLRFQLNPLEFIDIVNTYNKKTNIFLHRCKIEKILTSYDTFYKLTYKNNTFNLKSNEIRIQSKFLNAIFENLNICLKKIPKNEYESYIETIFKKNKISEKKYLEKKKIIAELFFQYISTYCNKKICPDNYLERKKLLEGLPIIHNVRYKGKRTKCYLFKLNFFIDSIQHKMNYFNLSKSHIIKELTNHGMIEISMRLTVKTNKLEKVARIKAIPYFDFKF
jgi:hypothetical protein